MLFFHKRIPETIISDNGYLFGIPSSDWKSNKDLVFLTYTYLTRSTSSSALSKLLKYIYLFPIRSDNMFLPTMREDVVSKFRATLGEKFVVITISDDVVLRFVLKLDLFRKCKLLR